MKVRELARRRAHREVAILMTCDDPRLAIERPCLAGCIDILAPKVWDAVVWRFHRGNRLNNLTDQKIRFQPPKDGQRGVVGRVTLSYRIDGEEQEYRRCFTVRRRSLLPFKHQLTFLIGVV